MSTYVANFVTDEGRTEVYVEAQSVASAVIDVLDRYPDCEGDYFQITVRKVPQKEAA